MRDYEETESADNPNPKVLGKASMWAVYGNTFSPCEKAIDHLEPGQYTIDYSQDRGIFVTKREVNLDDLILLPDSNSDYILQEIESFWDKEDRYKKFGFLWKRGVLLWGPPGSGKTTTVQMLSKMIIDRGGISVYVSNPTLGVKGLEIIRKIEPTRPIVVMLEDLDGIIKEYGEQSLLALLDGELQIPNVVFVATTNFPEYLEKRITNRPSRFDLVKKIPMPSADARRVFLQMKNPRFSVPSTIKIVQDQKKFRTLEAKKKEMMEKEHTQEVIDSLESIEIEKEKCYTEVNELDYWVDRTEEYSIAHLKELIISVELFGRPLEESLKRLNAMSKKSPSSLESGDDTF